MAHKHSLTRQNLKRMDSLVEEYKSKRNWPALTRLIGGNPRYDLMDYDDRDASGSHPDERYEIS